MGLIISIFIVVCALSGFLAGMLGLGGGALLVPLFLYIFPKFGLDQNVMQLALGTSFACVIVNTSMSTYYQYKKNSIDFSVVKYWGFFITCGAILGSFWASYANEALLKIIYIGVMSFLVLYRLVQPNKILFKYPSVNRTGLFFPVIIGAVSATMGIGAGNSAPALSLFGVKMQKAVGTASVLGISIAVPSVLVYMYTGQGVYSASAYTIGYIHLPSFIGVAAITATFVPLGVRLSHRMSHIGLNTIFCLLALVLIVNMGVQL